MTTQVQAKLHTVDGHRLEVADAGSGPPVFLLHGAAPGASSAGTWSSLTPVLARTHRVVAPDFLGFGGSDKPERGDYGIGLWTSQTLALADELGIDRFSVIGNSLGGRVGLQLALDAPERIDDLVLMSTRVAPSDSPAQTLLRNYRPDRDLMRELVTECFVHRPGIVTESLVERRYTLSALPGAHEAIQCFFRGGAAPPSTDLEKLLPTIEHRTLVLHGRHDKVVPVSNSITLAQSLPHAELHVFADTGHWFPLERADRFEDSVSHFLTHARD
ncbi:2,6-dioxo-6-phenylhexa-3-enoate hydrolase [Rhodococcoides trifolii]|uniref:2,6-dioxo-6-phenylhexa-3-enoate hydrolase n=1 Tax=Rhodococcoides trifolii TaxID=908250 RepID=A0A917LI73_9NOCA|nr:alpha/beta hydrolase [Rhodococcus trifolii]GGG27280.1 2,6-dioxo-6-phenylhexa-3-enoate hydrolase [Rhodococcus trifolii]